MSDKASLQQLLITNFGLSPSGYTGSRGDNGTNGAVGYTGSGAAGGGSGPTITAIAYPGDDTAADVAGGQTITLTGTGFASGAAVIINGQTASVVTVVNSTTITFTAPAVGAGSYIVYVVNTNGTTALAVPGIQYSAMPVWTTAAGTLGTYGKQLSFFANLAATGDAPISYSITSGTLPGNATLNVNTGVISGTTPNVASSTTYNFTIRSTDAQRQDTDRAFSITVMPNPVVEYLVVGGGGGGSGGTAGGGGGGGYRTATGYMASLGTPYTVTVGAGGAGAGLQSYGVSGTASVFATVTSSGGGAGGYTAAGGAYPGLSGGSGGGGANYSGVTGAPGSGTVGEGYAGAVAPTDGGGGGGGAGGAFVSATRNGGSGALSTITGSAVYYAGGGGGGDTATGGAGGAGGGGAGGYSNAGSPGTVNTGGGGGGGWTYAAGTGAAGGSGVVVVRYADTFPAAASTTGSPTITVTGGYRIYKWTSSGSITF